MYGWIWRHLPGNTLVRSLVSLLLAFGVVVVLFQWVFPWAEPLMPFNDVGVQGGEGDEGGQSGGQGGGGGGPQMDVGGGGQ
jgi:hypothetical protein